MKVTDYEFYIKMMELKNKLESNLNELKAHGKITNTIEDIQYAGTIEWIEIDSITNSEVPIYKDIYVSVEKKSDGNLVTKYYDENMDEAIAIDFHDSNGIVATKSSIAYSLMDKKDGKDFSSQFKDVQSREKLSLNDLEHDLEVLSKESKMSKEKILSILKEKNEELERISDATGISKKEIQSISELNDLDKIPEKKENNTVELKEDTNSSSKNKESESQANKDNPNIKQESDLNRRINDRYTLGDILGVPSNGKLVVVYSTAVKDNTSSTKYTFLIQDKEGHFTSCDNLELVGGTNPENNIYASNYDGSNVERTQANSAYRINSPLANEGFVLTAKTGSMGVVDLGLGQAPKKQGLNNPGTNLVTTPLKTTSTYSTSHETKELLSYAAGQYAADERSQEAENHKNKNCEITRNEVDGRDDTGHHHNEDHIISDENLFDIDTEMQKLYDEKGETEYTSLENFKSDFYKWYLHGNTAPSVEEFEKARNNYMNEHSLTKESSHEIKSNY